jgi:hypothetical protein
MDTIVGPDMAEKHQYWFPSAKPPGKKSLFCRHLVVATQMLRRIT